ncbi:MAG: transporter, partial [Anderseniella sp.]
INDKNSATDYKTGEEFHLEFAALKHFSPQFNAGLAGYSYHQISGDSGTGAVLGSFKGRVTALGPHVSWTFPVGQVPVSLASRVFVEFNTKNRTEGVAGYVIVTAPLGGPPTAQ